MQSATALSHAEPLPAAVPHAEPGAARPYGWILHPVVDLLFCCGGLVWILFALHRTADTGTPNTVTVALYAALSLLTVVFSNAHTMATLVRVYGDSATARQFSLYTRWLPLLGLAITVPGLLVPGAAAAYLKVYLIFLLPHHTMQVFGISLIYCFKRGYSMNELERKTLKTFLMLTAWFTILRQFTYPEWARGDFMYQTMPFWGPLPEWIHQVALAGLLGSGALLAVLLGRRAIASRQLPPLPAALLVGTVVTYMVSGGNDSSLMWLYVTPLFHGSQYIIVCLAYHLKRNGLPEGVAPHRIAGMLARPEALRYLGLLVLGGSFIYVGIPRLIENLGVPFEVSVGVILAVFNFHHFATDRAVWRLRDPAVRRALIA